MEIQQDLAYQEPVITMTGQSSVQIENYRSISMYTECEIRVQTVHGSVNILGTHLEILQYRADGMYVTGNIDSICVKGR
jgi:sporulation protein YqfC